MQSTPSKIRLLVIEDDPNVAAALRIRFESKDFAVNIAGDAIVGHVMALQLMPDLILLDISMPGGCGLALAERLAARPETRKIPIIFVTGSQDPGLRRRAMELNAAGLCEKPYDAEELFGLVQFALGGTSSFRRDSSRDDGATNPVLTQMKKILIIEDDRKIAMALSLRLKQAGYETALAYDALTGVAAALKFKPDLALLDITMPAGDGFSVAENLRQIMPHTPVMFLTASKRPGLLARAESLGAVGFFEKPYDPRNLVCSIERTLNANSHISEDISTQLA